jgi:uncharacterized protein (TIGR02145 family)
MKIIIFSLLLLCHISLFGQTVLGESSLTDLRDGKTYRTVKIGNQVWMAENLAFKIDSGCWAYENDERNVAKFGFLYSQEMAKKVCPAGWRLPSKLDLKRLLKKAEQSDDSIYNTLIPRGNSGYAVLFGGCHLNEKDYIGLEEVALFWSSSPFNKSLGSFLLVRQKDHVVALHGYNSISGFSVRCLRN